MPRDYIVSYELHWLSDASEKTYGWCCLYLKCVTKIILFRLSWLLQSQIKTKNKIMLPRLELFGSLISSHLILIVLNLFKGEIDISSLYAWSDSKVFLA